jgi:hypothetical protein
MILMKGGRYNQAGGIKPVLKWRKPWSNGSTGKTVENLMGIIPSAPPYSLVHHS